ncbi:MAG TPA: serine hydrolase [Kineobactrum sp.]
MKKLLITALALLGSALAAIAFVGPAYIASAPGVASGMGAKLLCSARYVSGFSEQQALDDLVQYSPLLEYLDIQYDTANMSVTTSLLGISSTTAAYLPGVGCSNSYPGFDQRNTLRTRTLAAPAGDWPLGDRVATVDQQVQILAEQLRDEDNAAGLNTRALVVVHKGRIVAEAYAQEAGPETPLLGWSMAKSMTSVMIGNLQLRGLVEVNEPAGFAEWAGDSRAAIKISDLLTMTDGLDFSEEYNPGDDATAMLFTEPSASAYALGKKTIHAGGSHFNYSSGTANLLSRLYFDRTGGTAQNSYDAFITYIASPLGFQHSIFETDASGVFVGASYLYASARDWARLGQMMLNGGQLNGQRIVSADWVASSTRPNTSQNDPAYGYQWWLNQGGEQLRWPNLPADAYAAQGNREQNVMVIPSAELVIVRLGWTSGRYPVNERFERIVSAVDTSEVNH